MLEILENMIEIMDTDKRKSELEYVVRVISRDELYEIEYDENGASVQVSSNNDEAKSESN